MDPDAWAVEEFVAAELGDSRRTARLLDLATALARHPSRSLPHACADEAQLDAAYRFFDNPHITPAALLQPHIHATWDRCAAHALILAPQDTTLLDYSHHPATTGLGPLATPTQQGLLVHSTLAFTPARVPLGLLAQATWARAPAPAGKRAQRRSLPLAEKESHKWLTSLAAVNAAAAACPQTHFISIGDREADVYDLFLATRAPTVDLVVRAAWDRRTSGEQPRLGASMAAVPVQTTLTLAVPRRGAQAARTATLTVRWRSVTLRPPKHRTREQLADVRVSAVWAVETTPPGGVAAVEWRLLTSCAVPDEGTALAGLGWYAARWGIEVWHKVLKSGCRIEARQLSSGARLERALALYSVIAWRIVYTTLLAREQPELPCSAVLAADEWAALYGTVHPGAAVPRAVPSLRQAVRWIAQLGGFVGRVGDGEPGGMVLWRGWQRLMDLTQMYRILRPPVRTNVLRKD
ncbi:MAG: IS4 family transposase [Chloroflexota bacterium]|nr:IS4 family transposase [Chloroflexota bacterium]